METFCRGDVLCGDVLYVRRAYINVKTGSPDPADFPMTRLLFP
jgi:hypothetical protein